MTKVTEPQLGTDIDTKTVVDPETGSLTERQRVFVLTDDDEFVSVSDEASQTSLSGILATVQSQANEKITDDVTPDLPLAPGAEFFSSWHDMRYLGHYIVLIATLEASPLATVELQWSDDGATPNGSATNLDSGTVTEGFNVYLDISSIFLSGSYFRVHIVNGATQQEDNGTFIVAAGLGRSSYMPTINLDADVSFLNDALLTRSVIMGQQPDGDYVNSPADGLAVDRDGVEALTDTPLPADGEYQTGWIDTDGWSQLELVILADQISAEQGIHIEFTNDANVADPVVVRTETLTFVESDVENGSGVFPIATTGDGVRITYVNGPTGQNAFTLALTLRTGNRAPSQRMMSGAVRPTDAGTIGWSRIFGYDDEGEFVSPGISDGGGQRISVREHEVETPIKSLPVWAPARRNVAVGSIVRVASAEIGRRSIAVKHNGGDGIVSIGPTAQDVQNGDSWPLDPKESIVIELDDGAEVWADVSGLSGDSDESNRNGTMTMNNNGVTNPNDLLTSNDIRASFDAAGESVDVSGFTALGTYPSISQVSLLLEGRKASAPAVETISHLQTVSTSQTGGTSIAAPALPASSVEHCYVAFVTNGRDAPHAVTSMTGLGLTWTKQAELISGGLGLAMFTAHGEAQAGQVIANFNDPLDDEATISVTVLDGVHPTNPLEGLDTQSGSGSNIDSDAIAGTAGTGMFLACAVVDDRTPTINSPVTSRAYQDAGRIESRTSTGSAAASNTVAGTIPVARPWVAIGATLRPAQTDDPVIEISYEVDGVPGESTLSAVLDQTTDMTFEFDITGDRAWTPADISDTVFTVTATEVGAAAAEIDAVALHIVEISEGGSVEVAVLNVGTG